MKAFALFVPVLLAASMATASLAQAQDFLPPPPMGERGLDRDEGPGSAPGMPRHGVKLSEAQQDKLFALHHAAGPALLTPDQRAEMQQRHHEQHY